MTSDPFDFFSGATPDRYVGQRIDLIRRAKGLKQAELALMAGINKGSLSRKIGGSQPWFLTDLVRIANALDVSVTDIIEGVERVKDADPALPRLDSNQQPFD